MNSKDLESLKFYLKKEPMINKWRRKALKFMLTSIAPKIDEYDYYNIKEFVNVVSRLNEPFQPCANHFKKCNDEYIGTIFTQVKTLHLIRKITNTKSAKEKNKNNS